MRDVADSTKPLMNFEALRKKIGLTSISNSSGKRYSVWIAKTESGTISGVYAEAVGSTDKTIYGASIWFQEDMIGTGDIDSPQGSGLGSVLMWVMCQIGRAKDLKKFGVSSGVATFWEKSVKEGWLNDGNAYGEFVGEITEVEKHCADHASEKGWDLRPLANLLPYIGDVGSATNNNANTIIMTSTLATASTTTQSNPPPPVVPARRRWCGSRCVIL